MHKKRHLIVFISLLTLLIACTKDIKVIPDDAIVSKFVVEGWIENNEFAIVKLTRSSGYFDPIPSLRDTAGLLDYIFNDVVVQNAIITVSDGVQTDTLKPIIDFINFTTKYRLPMVYIGSIIKGEVGKSYQLKVEAEGKTLLAITKIPELVELDTLYWRAQFNDSTIGFPWTRFKDPDTLGNAYRIFTKRGELDENYTAALGSEFDDYFINGTQFDFPFNRGEQLRDDTLERDERSRIFGKYQKGELMQIKFCTMDKASYDFWRSFSISQQSGGSPFAAPLNLKSNIQGEGMGVWCGYGATFIEKIAE